VSSQQVDAATTHTYQFDEYEIRATTTVVDGNRGYELTKIGKDPFSLLFTYPESTLHINHITEIDGNHVIYGYIHYSDADTYYEGFMTILSPSGEELDHIIYDYDTDEDVRYIHVMDSVILVAVSSLEKNDRDQYDFLKYTIHAYDYNYTSLETFDVYEEIEAFYPADTMLLFNFNYDSMYDLGITTNLELIYPNTPLAIEPDQQFIDQVTIPFLNRAFLNDREVFHGVHITTPGYYELKYDGYTYLFEVVPSISGVQDGGVYDEPITPIISSGRVYLDHDLFVSGTTISEPGEYQLVIQGQGGYQEQVSFTITTNIEGITHNNTYEQPVELSFNGTGYLNNGYITSPYIVEEPGEYMLRIEGENEYRETYFFTIDNPSPQYTLIDFLKQYDLAILGVTLLSGFLILKKK
jgi:hypothetical protein